MSAHALKSRRRFAAALAALAIVTPAIAQDPNASVAQNAARDWLSYADTLDGRASYEHAGKKFRDAMLIERWTEALAKEREARGKVERRTIKATQFRRQVHGYEDGDYALVVFRTVFAQRPDSEESITLEREADGVWRVVGYLIR